MKHIEKTEKVEFEYENGTKEFCTLKFKYFSLNKEYGVNIYFRDFMEEPIACVDHKWVYPWTRNHIPYSVIEQAVIFYKEKRRKRYVVCE